CPICPQHARDDSCLCSGRRISACGSCSVDLGNSVPSLALSDAPQAGRRQGIVRAKAILKLRMDELTLLGLVCTGSGMLAGVKARLIVNCAGFLSPFNLQAIKKKH